MMIDWLKKRLSPVKRDTTRWIELSEAIQEYWATYFDPSYDRVEALRSIYTASLEDQRALVIELGGYFEYDMPDDNIPILVAQRKLELQQKETTLPLKAALRRLGFRGSFDHLYAKPAEAYGTAFYTEAELLADSIDPETCILTSRSALGLTLVDTVLVDMELITLAMNRVKQIKPLHIIFEGLRLNTDIADTVDDPDDGGVTFDAQYALNEDVPWGEILHNGAHRYAPAEPYGWEGTVILHNNVVREEFDLTVTGPLYTEGIQSDTDGDTIQMESGDSVNIE